MTIEIKHRFSNAVLCSFEALDIKDCLQQALKSNLNLSCADLYGADLRDAYLRGANLSGEILAISPLFIIGLHWQVTVTESFLNIGCKRYEHEEWAKFSDDGIADMDDNAAKFWTANKTWLLSACKEHHKESLAFRKENKL